MWHPGNLDPSRVFDGASDFDERILPGLAAIPFFRAPTDEEVTRSWAAYRPGGGAEEAAALVEVWRGVAAPTRATLTGFYDAIYHGYARLPSLVLGLSFLATLRSALDAGVRFRASLSPTVQKALEEDFPWLMHRHEHVPAGPFPSMDFADGFREFLDSASTLDDARARWQMVAALNEVEQTVYSRWLSDHFGLPALIRHSERERELAINYLVNWSPRVTERLWRQCLTILDALNARVFAMTCIEKGPRILLSSLAGAVSRRGEWRDFVTGLEKPQRLGSVRK